MLKNIGKKGMGDPFSSALRYIIPIKKKATLPALVTSSFSACILALLFQQTTLADVVQSLYKGYDTSMAVWMNSIPEELSALFDRGGLYELSEPVIISIIVYVGAIDLINAMPIIVNRVFGFAKSRGATIIATLASTSFINAFTSNQMAASFIVGEAFHKNYDQKGMPRKLLSLGWELVIPAQPYRFPSLSTFSTRQSLGVGEIFMTGIEILL